MSRHPLDQLSAFLDGELDSPENDAVSSHVRACAECTRALEDLASVDAAARAVEFDVPSGYFDTFTERLRPRLADARPARAPRRLPAWALAAAAAVLAAAVTPSILRQARPPAALDTARPEPRPPQARASQTPVSEGASSIDATAPSKPAPPAPAPKRERDGGAATPKEAPAAALAKRLDADKPSEIAANDAQVQTASIPEQEAPAAKAVATPAAPMPVDVAAETGIAEEAAPKTEEKRRAALSSAARAPAARDEAVSADAPGAATGAMSIDDELGRHLEGLRSRTASNAAESRDLREAYRGFLDEHGNGPHAADAWLRIVELGAAVVRESRSKEDWDTLQSDAATARRALSRDPLRLARIAWLLRSAQAR